MTIGENIVHQVSSIRATRARPRQVVLNWMGRNDLWYREFVAKEWAKQAGENWEDIFFTSVKRDAA